MPCNLPICSDTFQLDSVSVDSAKLHLEGSICNSKAGSRRGNLGRRHVGVSSYPGLGLDLGAKYAPCYVGLGVSDRVICSALQRSVGYDESSTFQAGLGC